MMMKPVRSTVARWLQAALFSVPLVGLQVVVGSATASLTGIQGGVAHAQDDEKSKYADRPTRRTPTIRNAVFEQLSKAQEAVEAKNFREAAKVLDEMLEDDLNANELANVYNVYAFVAYSQENYRKALEYYQKVLDQVPNINIGMEDQTRYAVAQLFFLLERWQEGIDALTEYMKTQPEPSANSYVLLAQGYYQLQQFDKSLQNIEKAISMYKAKGKVPKEQWYTLARYLHYEKNNFPKVVSYLEELIRHYPKKDYWVQLSHMYGEQKKESLQTAAMDTAYVQGLLEKERELVTMAYLYLGAEVPYESAQVLDQGIKRDQVEQTAKNLELLANSWRQAQEIEKAIPVMEQAARKSDTGEIWARLGNIYLDNYEYKKAADAIRAGLRKGGVRRPDQARLALGMAEFNLKNYEAAREAFVAARKDERSRKFANQWLQYLQKELERQESLRDA